MTVPSTLTGYTDTQLAGWLDEVRKVAALRDQEALDATDALLWSFLEWREHGAPGATDDPEVDRWDADALEEQIQAVRETIARLREQPPAGLRHWDADLLIERANELGRHAHRRVRERYADPIAQVRTEANRVAGEVRLAFHEQAIRGAGEAPIRNVKSLDAIARTIEQARVGLTQAGKMTPELQTLSRAALVRLAGYRAGRKLAEAEVADAGGSTARAAKLRREAEAMRQQDEARYSGVDRGVR